MARFKSYADALVYVGAFNGIGRNGVPKQVSLKSMIRETLIWKDCVVSVVLVDTLKMAHQWYFSANCISDDGLVIVNDNIVIVYKHTESRIMVRLLSPCHNGLCVWSSIILYIIQKLGVFETKQVEFDSMARVDEKTL